MPNCAGRSKSAVISPMTMPLRNCCFWSCARRRGNGKCRRANGSRQRHNSPFYSANASFRRDRATGPAHKIPDSPVEQEGTASTLRAFNEVFGEHGLPMSVYTDRGSHYFRTPEAGGKVDRAHLTQVGRPLAQLGVE